MAVSFYQNISRNLSKNVFKCSRIAVDYCLGKRSLSNDKDQGEKENAVKEVNSKSVNTNEQGAENSDPYAPFPDDMNPVTGEKGGPRGPEPTRYGDWERKGRCIDF